ncbi:ubiquitin carboxyl-terminal hydrolase isozyme L3 isoform X2 [Rhineura floridana]|uniref:ubiquitin carboxyl-terminal hydrolase isozyme L3 isoform X2 n=1 Tax=Rhineura floridana TaxID=261503 RepID=UPI002AC881BB|nr:ubiquitin carboxyl-terminal hydrolase isozyme L3 isoform X2 [Rhineura floridana]
MESHRWLPLEANPDFLRQLGIHPSWQFVDVYGMDPELLSMVPRPVCAVLLLFPVTEKYETFRTEEEAKIKAQGQEVKPSVYFMKQTISNACGTIGLIHAIANNRDKINFEVDSSLKKFLDDSVPMTPEERAKYLETYEAIRVTHESSAHEGQTESSSSSLPSPSSSSQPQFSHCKMKASPLRRSASLTLIRCNHVASAKTTSTVKATSPPVCLQRWRPTIPLSSIGLHSFAPSIDEKVDLHFIALVNVGGNLFELDGRKPFPINHGQSSNDTFLEDAVEVCKKFMERDPDELRFNAIALVAA